MPPPPTRSVPTWLHHAWLDAGFHGMLGCGVVRLPAGRRWQRQSADHWALLCGMSGQLTVVREAARFVVGQNDMLILPPGQPRSMRTLPHVSEAVFLKFFIRCVTSTSDHPQLLAMLNLPALVRHPAPDGLADARRRIEAIGPITTRTPLASRLKVDALILDLLADFIAAGFSTGELKRAARRPVPTWVEQLRQYLRRNFRHTVTMADLAKFTGYSPPHIQAAFREHFNRTPLQFHRHYRVQMAAHLLEAAPDMTIRQLVDNCGYDSERTFNRHFRDAYGVSPRRWLARDRNGSQSAVERWHCTPDPGRAMSTSTEVLESTRKPA